MKPLQSIAMGMIVILLLVLAGDYDLLPNPLGWVLVIVGLRSLPRGFELRSTMLGLAVLAGVVSVPLWIPAVLDALEDADESIAWALNLPQFGCYLLVCLALSREAVRAGEKPAGAWWSTMVLAYAVVIALPVLIFGGGLDGFEALAGVLVGLVPTATIVLLFVYSGREWPGAPPPAQAADPTELPPQR